MVGNKGATRDSRAVPILMDWDYPILRAHDVCWMSMSGAGHEWMLVYALIDIAVEWTGSFLRFSEGRAHLFFSAGLSTHRFF